MVCVSNRGYAASLERRKIYQACPDPLATKRGLIRVVDESGEDYLFPSGYFIRLSLPRRIADAISKT